MTAPISSAAPLQPPGGARVRSLTLLFAIAVGVIVLPLYAAQPLIEEIGTALGFPARTYGLIATMSMLGYAAGLSLLVPLIDLLELRRITLAALSAEILALLATAFAPGAAFFCVAAFAAGAAASAIQMLVPAAASLAGQEQRGRVIGNVMSGLMIGILVSRPLASLAAQALGWRGAYGLDAVALLLIWAALYRTLPIREPEQNLGYGALIGSLLGLLATEPVLRRRAGYQALCMGAFGIFWSGVALRLSQPPFELGQTGIALFALAGIGGAVIAPVAGWLGDRGLSLSATRAAHGAVMTGSVLAGIAGAGWLGFDPASRPQLALGLLVLAALVLDLGVIGDQTLGRRAVNLLCAAAPGRLNGVYTGLFFVGGSIGAALAGVARASGGWPLVCATGAAFGALALGLSALGGRDRPEPPGTRTFQTSSSKHRCCSGTTSMGRPVVADLAAKSRADGSR
jgi:predicted MFS family arabinose efflux permease